MYFRVFSCILSNRNTNTKTEGDNAVGKAISYFLNEGYEVLLPIGGRRRYDTVIERNNVLQRVQVKFAGKYKNGKCKAGLRITGGNQKILYAKKYSDIYFDFLLVYTEEGESFFFPWKEIRARNELTVGNKKYIKYKVKN